MQRNSSNIFLGTGVDQVEKVSLARFTVKHLLFPNLDQQTIDMLATRLGEIVKRKKPRYGPSSINPSSADVQILKEMFSDTHSKVTSSGISVAQAFGLLNTFERNIGNIATAEEAYAAIQCADEITTATKLVRSKKLGGIKSARNRRKSNQERNRRISLIAKKMLQQGKSRGTIVHNIAARKTMPSRTQVYKILRDQCPDWKSGSKSSKLTSTT